MSMQLEMYMLLSFCLLAWHCPIQISADGAMSTFSIVNYGATPNEQSDSTKGLLSAWSAACSSGLEATVYVPPGRFLVGQSATFSGPCRSRVTVKIDGVLVAPSEYGGLGKEWLLFDQVNGLSIVGGTIDGQGDSLWKCKSAENICPVGSSSLVITNSDNVFIGGLTSINSKLYHIDIRSQCNGVHIQDTHINAPWDSPNTDGIHVQESTDVTISGGSIGTGDDCISVGPGTTGLWIEGVNCGPGHGISIGSLGKDVHEAGVRNVTVTTVTFKGTENGVRIKTWGSPNQGFVDGVVFQHAIMQDVKYPIIITQYYCPNGSTCPNENSGVKISHVTYNDIQGSSATPVAVKFDCSPSNPCSGINLQDIKLTYGNSKAQSYCNHAGGITSGFVIPPSCLSVEGSETSADMAGSEIPNMGGS